MECLKKKFFILDIKSQIQYGILFVSSCVCLLVFLLIITYSFVMINLSYVDIIAVIDLKETEAIHKINDYYLNYQLVNEETSKISIQWVRNILKNFEGKQSLIDPEVIKNSFLNLNQLMPRTIKNNCFFYKSNNPDTDEQLLNSHSEFLGRLYLTLPVLNIISRVGLIGGRNLNIFEKFIIHSIPMNTTFSLANSNLFNNEFHFNQSANDLFNSYLNKLNYINENTNINDYIDEINKEFIGNRTIKQIAEKNPGNIMTNNKQKLTLSFKLQNDNDDLLDNLIVGQWNSELSDIINDNILDEFLGIKIITTKEIQNNTGLFKKEILNSFETCEYFRYLQKFKNPLQSANFQSLDGNSSLTDCFHSDITKHEFEKLMNLNKWLSYKYKRKLKIPLFLNDKSFKLNSNYKIIKSQYPDEKSLQIFTTDFIVFDKYNLYLFSNSKYSENIYNFIFLKFLAMMMSIILSNLVLWTLILFNIFLLELKLTSKLTNPIKTLIKTLHQINKLDNNHLLKEIDQIQYEDDSNINELFRICREMIQGGFKVNIEKTKCENLEIVDKIYEIYEIKLNNIIICEDKIENDYNKNVKNMFNFVPADILDNKFIKNTEFDSESENGINLLDNSKIEDIKFDKENSSFIENNQSSYHDTDDINLSFVRDDLISSEQKKKINKILLNSEFEKIELKERINLKNMSRQVYQKSQNTHTFFNLENYFDNNLDKTEIKHASNFTSYKSKQNILYFYYDQCVN